MDTGGDKRQEKYHKNLGADGLFHLIAAHADLLHDFKTALIVIPFGDLFVIHNQNRSHDEQDPKENAEEEQTAVYR